MTVNGFSNCGGVRFGPMVITNNRLERRYEKGGDMILTRKWMTIENEDSIDEDDSDDSNDDSNDNGKEDSDENNDLDVDGKETNTDKDVGTVTETEMEMDINQNNNDLPSTIPDLSWRVEKMRLEEANKRRFLKSKPRFLPYEQCRKWVQAWGNRWESEAEWVSWIDDGEKRNSYIPARPDEYYTRTGKWQGWDHFLGTEKKSDNSSNSSDSVDDGNDFQ